MFWPDGQTLSVLVLTDVVVTKPPVPSFWLQVRAGGATEHTFVCVTIGADIVLDATGSEMLLGEGHE
jgi:hypothetical protein